MKALIISDLHLTDSPSEEYRWNIFQWTQETLVQQQCTHLFILGDIFDKKDRHPARIVTRLVKLLVDIAVDIPIIILQGNHDVLLKEHPFLSFVDHLPNVRWISQPELIEFDHVKTVWLPHTVTPIEEWEVFFKGYTQVDMAFAHIGVIGSKVSNYFELLDGVDLKWLEEKLRCPILSGHIHVPQTIRSLTYIGSPHPVSFGDDDQYRGLLWTPLNSIKSLPIPSIKRHSLAISSLDELKELYDNGTIKEHDHIKIKIVLTSEQLSQWSVLKEIVTNWCDYHKIKLFDIKLEKVLLGETEQERATHPSFIPVHPTQTFQRYLAQTALDEAIARLGQEILTEVLNECSSDY